jgi:hypothetical protein
MSICIVSIAASYAFFAYSIGSFAEFKPLIRLSATLRNTLGVLFGMNRQERPASR